MKSLLYYKYKHIVYIDLLALSIPSSFFLSFDDSFLQC